MRLDINKIIYGYLFICMLLLFYNIFYIAYSNRREKKFENYVGKWQYAIIRQVTLLREGLTIEPEHQRQMERQLVKTDQLIAYSRALDRVREQGEELVKYLWENYLIIQELAVHYSRKESMEKAFFAYYISKNPPCDGKEYRQIMEIILSYFEDSTVYCRENILNALYVLGNAQAIENAFHIINERKWFHHPKLLSDGLNSFTGDKEELAERLWSFLGKWNDNLMVSIVNFITVCSDKFKSRFLEVIQSNNVSLEVRLAILRYFRRYPDESVRPLLLLYLKDENLADINIKIVTASVLERYPGEDTVAALKSALSHPNWYLRYNAATSLVNLEVDITTLRDILREDRYAKEIYVYMMDRQKAG